MNDITVILADDDEINNYLSVSVIGEFVAAGQIFAFTSPGQAVREAKSICADQPSKRFVFFIDINMPEFSGWEMVRQLQSQPGFDFNGKDRIYILSSSINPADRVTAVNEISVTGFVEKPLTIGMMEGLLK
jgi:CheY-like chemotaxis protein